MTSLGRVVQNHEKHIFDIDRTVPERPEFNRCQIEAATNGVPEVNSATNPWRPWCNVVPRFAMVTLDAVATSTVTFTVAMNGATETLAITVDSGSSFARAEFDADTGFGAAEYMQIVATEPGTGYTSATITVVVDAPPQCFLSGTLIFAAGSGEVFTHLFFETEGGGG